LLHQMAMMSLQQQAQQQHHFSYIYPLLQCKIGCDFGARKAEGGCWRLDSSQGSPTTNTTTCTASILLFWQKCLDSARSLYHKTVQIDPSTHRIPDRWKKGLADPYPAGSVV
jgi:hypothetical protein